MTTILVGPRSTKDAVTGMRIAFDLLVSGFVDRSLDHIVINRSEWSGAQKAGKFSLGKALFTVRQLMSFYAKLWRGKTVYIAIGTSRSGFFRDALMIWPSWFLRKRLVLHLHGGGFRDFYQNNLAWFQFFMRHTFSKADAIVVLGELLRDQFAFVDGVEEKIRVVPNGLPNGFQGITGKPKRLHSKKPLNILYLSNMIPSKGYLDVLEACHILHNIRQVPIQCDFCGTFLETIMDENKSVKYDEQHFLARIREYGLESVVEYHGAVRGTHKQYILQSAHVFVLPTSFPWEGQPISIIEALAFCTPVISTYYRGIPEQVRDGYNGFLVAPKSPEEIADAVENMWRSPKLYRKISQNAFEQFEEFFTQEAHLNRLIPIILGQETAGRTL
ncbi:MAG: hypothetical protein DRI56_04465 [Chloroflexota bacterium]|nr:MAG: hypothetical protein DRI56_04465 [Chloroflexota bacterium]